MFIVIDGPDGSGKTTLAMGLASRLQQDGISTIYTYEPTYESKAGKELRRLMKIGGITDLYAFVDLFVVDRKEHIKSLIVPALERGEYIVCDRYKYSALAYQQLQGVSAEYLVEINKECLIPNIAFILMPKEVDVLLHRILDRGKDQEIFEEKEFLSRTLEFYKKLPSYFPDEQIIFLEAEDSVKENIEKVIGYLSDKEK